MKRFAKPLVMMMLLLAIPYCGIAAWVYTKQESLLFYPVTLPPSYRFNIPNVIETTVAVDGAVLSALHLKLDQAKGLVFYLHGNGGNLAGWFTNSAFYQKLNFDLFMIDYRGYGKSTGRIESEAQLRDDVRKAFAQIAPQYQGKRIVILGRSLGTGLAAGLAAETRPDLTILVSPYYSMRDMARQHYPYLPVQLLRYPLETWRDIPRIENPLLLVHGERDTLIPVSHSDRLWKIAKNARLLHLPQAGHDDVHQFDEYRGLLTQYLNAL